MNARAMSSAGEFFRLLGLLVGAVALAALVLIACAGCAGVELCMTHPKYGRVCVAYDGKIFVRADLSQEEREEVGRWVRETNSGKSAGNP